MPNVQSSIYTRVSTKESANIPIRFKKAHEPPPHPQPCLLPLARLLARGDGAAEAVGVGAHLGGEVLRYHLCGQGSDWLAVVPTT